MPVLTTGPHMQVHVGSAFDTQVDFRAKSTDVWSVDDQVFTRAAGKWIRVYPAPLPDLTAFLSHAEVFGAGLTSPAETLEEVTCFARGGLEPHSFFWEFVSGDPEIDVSGSSVVQSTKFKAEGADGTYNATWRCRVVEELNGDEVFSGNVAIEITIGGL